MSKVTIVYVKGSIRKDAVEITPKECRITEARLLETAFGGGWIPQSLRAVEVSERPTASSELERLERLYGAEMLEKAYGNAASARQAITEILAMDAAKVKASGLLVENDTVPVEVIGEDGDAIAQPKKGGKKGKAVEPKTEPDQEETAA